MSSSLTGGRWRLLIFLPDSADPLWLLATVCDPSHVLPDEATTPAEAAAWAGGLTGGPVTLHLARAVVYRVHADRP